MSNDLYKNKYRIPTNRLHGWDYSSSAWYFITVCTKNREHYFGQIIDGEMEYTELGHVAIASWLAMHRVFKILIPDAWVIMPNHTHFLFALQKADNQYQPNKFKTMVKNSASSIINHFKGRVTKYADKNKIEFGWQTRFHDHIVRDNDDFITIQNYIIENPPKWDTDKFFS